MARTKNHGNKGGSGGGGSKAAQPAAKPAHLEIPSSMPSKFSPTVEVSLADAIAELKTIREEEWEEILPTCCLLLKERIAFLAPAAADAAASAPALASSIAPCGNHVGGASEESGMPRGPITPTYAEPVAEPSSGDTQDAASRVAGSGSSATPSVGSDDSAITSAAGSSKSDSAASEADEQDSRSEASSEATIKASEADKTYQGAEAQDEQGEEETSPQADNAKESLKIFIPVHKYPGFNFIGRLLGPRGVTLKNLQNKSGCRLYIRGRGSLRFKDVHQEQLKANLPGYEHLHEALHVLIEYEGPSDAKDSSLEKAEGMVNELLVPPVSDDQDELKKTQLKELAILNGTYQENKTLNSFGSKARTEQIQQIQQQQQQQQQQADARLPTNAPPFQAHAAYMPNNGSNANNNNNNNINGPNPAMYNNGFANGHSASGRGMMMNAQGVCGRGTGTLFQPAPMHSQMARSNMQAQQMHLMQRQQQMQQSRRNSVYNNSGNNMCMNMGMNANNGMAPGFGGEGGDFLSFQQQQQQQQNLLRNNIGSQFCQNHGQGGADFYDNTGFKSSNASGLSRSSSASSSSSLQPKSAPYVPLWTGEASASGYQNEYADSQQQQQQQDEQPQQVVPVVMPASTLWVPPQEAQCQVQDGFEGDGYRQYEEQDGQDVADQAGAHEEEAEQWVDDDFVAALSRTNISQGTPSGRRKSFGTPTHKSGRNETYSPCLFGSIETPPGNAVKQNRVALGDVSEMQNNASKVAVGSAGKQRWHPYQRSPHKGSSHNNFFSFDAPGLEANAGPGGGYRLF